jgi:hypothetical protein
MAAEIISLSTIDFTSQTYNDQDVNLISSFDIDTTLTSESYIEFFIYDNNRNLIIPNYNFTNYTVLNNGQSAGSNNSLSQIEINPEEALIEYGFTQGEYITYFNFLNKKIGSNLQQLYISEISSDRTEIRLDSTSLTPSDIVSTTNDFIAERDNSPYFLDFYLNFGDNQLAIANNIQLDNQDPNNPTILIKLYEPLPEGLDLNTTLWVVTAVEEPIAYQVIFEDIPVTFIDSQNIKGPNFNIDLKDQVNNSTQELSYLDLITTTLTSSQNQLSSLLEEKEIEINVDYTDFSNFVHFSSAQTRLENFYYKVILIEEYNDAINLLNNTTNSTQVVSSSAAVYESKINDIITNFDGYEYYLYYETGSTSWPKTNNQKPYTLAASDSTQVLTWFGSTNYASPYYGGSIVSASEFDNGNKDNLLYTIPEYLRDDPANDPYQLFVEMVGQHYDNIWIYYKDITNKYGADNRLEYGISNDIVADAIRDFGVKLYQNNFSNEDLYTAFLGLTPDGGLFPFPNITGSLPTPSGYEYVNTKVSASNDYLPLDDVNKSLYKRIYHNLPYLLKSKGTLPGLRALITSYGIPDTILRINEYGGKDRINTNDWDFWQNEFNYALTSPGTGNCLETSFDLNSQWGASDNTPEALMLRFKLATKDPLTANQPENIFQLDSNITLNVVYTGSGLASGSYSGSISNPYYQYATLTLSPDPGDPTVTASVYLPFYNQGWWSVMVNAVPNGAAIDYTLYAANKIYEGGDNGTLLGFIQSASISSDKGAWIGSNQVSYGTSLSGSFQEIRYYANPISESIFKDYVMNPSSIEGNSLNSGPNELAFRASLGGELYTGSVSIHPKVTGSWITTSSFTGGNNSFNPQTAFEPNTEYFFYDQPVVGIKNAVNDKIRIENNVMPEGDVLSPFMALSQQANISQSYTPNINYLEVAFSPQNEINEDIMDQMGYFNIGEFIGDPRLRSSSAQSYPALDKLRNDYFEKYTKNYDLVDFVRLIKFFDNSLFKMIKDFVPARTSLASGVVIKQHILERNKYPQPQVNWTNVTYTGSINSTQIWNPITQENEISHSLIETFSGGTGGSFERFNYVGNTEQSWTESINTLSGSVLVIHSSQDEFYDGEFSGSMITVTTQSLNTPYPLDNQDFNYTPVVYSTQNYNLSLADTLAETQFLNPLTIPSPGQILMLDNWINLTISGITSGASYIKIHKFDNNGVNNSTVIGQITKLLIKLSVYSFYSEINILSINEFPTYYLCEVNTIPTQDDYIKNYKVSASFTSSTFQFNSLSDTTLFPYQPSPVNTNIFNQFNTSSGIYTSPGTPNILLSITASITTSGSAGSIWTLIKNGVSLLDGNTPGSSQIVQPSGSNITRTLSGSFFALDGDIIQLVGYRDGSGFSQIVKSGSLLITQSIAPSAQEYDSVIFEPYITTPNYYNSDNNPTINNINNDRLSTIYEDVDYSTGITTPQNFSLIISGSALKAAVQDSNYTSKRVTIPRYDGSKSTSQYLNIWTPGDEGTYGKLPTVESLKTTVAYCDFIGGYPPERMNASGAHILYLINADGTVSIPNTTPNSLQSVQGNFLTGERFEVNTKGLGTQNTPYRTIIRGGSLIKPILYTQIGHTPANWTSSLNLINSNIQSNITNITVISNINEIATFGGSNIAQQFTSNQETLGNKDNLVPSDNSGWNVTYDNGNYRQGNGDYYYLVPSAAITQGIDIIVDSNIVIYNPSYNSMTVQVTLKRFRGGGETNLQVQTITFGTGETKIVPFYVTLKPQIDILTNDQLYITIRRTTSLAPGNSDGYVLFNGTYFNIQQNPLPNPLPSASVATGSVWNYPTSSTYNQASSSNAGIIFMPLTSSILNVYYDVEGVRQQDITGSGFNPIDTDWSVQIGDEFRFEGREDRTFMVNKVFPPTLSSPERISNTGSLEVHLDSSIPSASINLDHFLIRRYTDDASFISFEGFKPSNSTGPYIIKPEFVVPELDKDIDSFILDLTQKGLIT